MENYYNLTPSQVKELRELGIQFSVTVDCWVKDLEDKWHRMEFEEAQYQYESPDTIFNECIQAPNSQEVIDKLPKYVEVDGSKFWFIQTFTNKNEWTVGYENMDHLNGSLYRIEGLIHFHNKNPLIANFELLKYTLKNYPNNCGYEKK